MQINKVNEINEAGDYLSFLNIEYKSYDKREDREKNKISINHAKSIFKEKKDALKRCHGSNDLEVINIWERSKSYPKSEVIIADHKILLSGQAWLAHAIFCCFPYQELLASMSEIRQWQDDIHTTLSRLKRLINSSPPPHQGGNTKLKAKILERIIIHQIHETTSFIFSETPGETDSSILLEAIMYAVEELDFITLDGLLGWLTFVTKNKNSDFDNLWNYNKKSTENGKILFFIRALSSCLIKHTGYTRIDLVAAITRVTFDSSTVGNTVRRNTRDIRKNPNKYIDLSKDYVSANVQRFMSSKEHLG